MRSGVGEPEGLRRALERLRAGGLALEREGIDNVRVACADAVRAMGVPLDALICNAGVMGLQTLEQVGGIERHFATNHLGHFLLARHLIDRVKEADQGRVVVVSVSSLSDWWIVFVVVSLSMHLRGLLRPSR